MLQGVNLPFVSRYIFSEVVMEPPSCEMVIVPPDMRSMFSGMMTVNPDWDPLPTGVGLSSLQLTVNAVNNTVRSKALRMLLNF